MNRKLIRNAAVIDRPRRSSPSPSPSPSPMPSTFILPRASTRHRFVETRRDSALPWTKSQSASDFPPSTLMETIADGIERNTKVRRERKDFSTVGGNTGGATMEDDDGVLNRVSLRNRRYGGRERGKSAFVRSSVERESAVVEWAKGERGGGKE